MLPENSRPPHNFSNCPSLKWYNLSSRFLSLENSSDFKETTNQKKKKNEWKFFLFVGILEKGDGDVL